MLTHTQLQEQLQKKLNISLSDTLRVLSDVFSNEASTFQDIAVVNNNLLHLEKENRIGTIRQEDFRIEFAKITSSTIQFIGLITPDIAAEYELRNAIFSKILIICRSEDRAAYLQSILSSAFYKGVEYDLSQKPLDKKDVLNYDLLIYDNYPFLGNDHPHDLLRYYLDLTPQKPYLLYFGQNLNLLYQYPKKAYFTNSIFSIHARIQEMMTFIKYYQAESPA